ncbi:MAG: fructose-bisphosphate aldolase, partial [Archaeoglobaceae archaeon]
MVGKKRRMNRILKNGRTLIAPMDHGITNPAKGLEDMDRIMRMVDCGADAVVVHKGIAKNSEYLKETNMGLIIHLSASTSLVDTNDKRLITSVEKAVQLGADAVSVHVN